MDNITKKLTGVQFAPSEFRKLNQCVLCLKACNIELGENCDKCEHTRLKVCDTCECLMRGGFHRYYLYDNRDDHRDNGVGFLASKEMIREFMVEIYLPAVAEDATQCNGCSGFEQMMHNVCGWCNKKFENTKDNYKLNGNMCEDCAIVHEKTTK